MFSSVDVCHDYEIFSNGPVYRRVSWATIMGFRSRLEEAAQEAPPGFVEGREVGYCDPRPPGSGRT